ncbi:NAD(P)-dependent malic enzyme [Desulfothermobacter acidiphilus]|uniref:NAD(P)-dependent malic enzyme n=1 Tax=Desulfothermobacter acidiphilus TaxID=1938353 RepID=UPI003F8A9367
MTLEEEALALHLKHRGKISVESKLPVRDRHDLSLIYTPGVGAVSALVAEQKNLVYDYTAKGNLVAVVTDGTAVLGLGHIGPEAALPVMEGKAVLFKLLAGVDAFPLCLRASDPEAVVTAVRLISPTFGGINLEDIAAPACFYIEERLRQELDIPVFHDDQHGTAVVVAAALLNALRCAGKSLEAVRVVVIGAGAAGLAVTRLLLDLGAGHLLVCDREGILVPGKTNNPYKEAVARLTNPAGRTGDMAEALRGADVLIGVSSGGIVTPEMVASMASDPIVFALANPEPEIRPELARQAGAAVIATGRSDYPNQVNNALAFPGIFRGALDARAREINEAMKLAAVRAIAGLVPEPHPECIIPDPLDPRVAPAVARAVAEAARLSGVARV